MSIICQICDYENEEGSIICYDCGEELKKEPESRYRNLLKMLSDTANKLKMSTVSYTQAQLEDTFSNIMGMCNELLDKTQDDLEKNLIGLEDMAEEHSENLGFEIDDNKSMDIFRDFVLKFQDAQDNINEGLFMAGDVLKNMRNLSDIEINKSRNDIQRAIELVQEGVHNLEISSINAKEKLFSKNELPPLPEDIMDVMDNLSMITQNMSEYISTRNEELIKSNIALMEHMLDYFYELTGSVRDKNKSDRKDKELAGEKEIEEDEEDLDELRNAFGTMLDS